MTKDFLNKNTDVLFILYIGWEEEWKHWNWHFPDGSKTWLKNQTRNQGGNAQQDWSAFMAFSWADRNGALMTKSALQRFGRLSIPLPNAVSRTFFGFQLFLSILVIYRQLRTSKSCLLTFMILILMLCISSFHCSLEISFDSGLIDAFNWQCSSCFSS